MAGETEPEKARKVVRRGEDLGEDSLGDAFNYNSKGEYQFSPKARRDTLPPLVKCSVRIVVAFL